MHNIDGFKKEKEKKACSFTHVWMQTEERAVTPLRIKKYQTIIKGVQKRQSLKCAGCYAFHEHAWLLLAPQRVTFFPPRVLFSITHELTSGLHDSQTLINALSKWRL